MFFCRNGREVDFWEVLLFFVYLGIVVGFNCIWYLNLLEEEKICNRFNLCFVE